MGSWIFSIVLLAGVKVGASIPPLAGWIHALAPESEVVCMLQGATSPHTFSPSPSLYRKLQQVQGLVYVGNGVDGTWVPRVIRALTPPPEILVLNTLLNAPPRDPHVWLSLSRLPLLTDRLAGWLRRLDPPSEEEIRVRSRQYRARIQQVRDSLLHARCPSYPPVLLSHSAWETLFRELGIPVVGVVHPVPDQPPGPRSLGRLIEKARKQGVRWVIVDRGERDAISEAVARELHARILVLDPVGSCENPVDPLFLILSNLQRLERAWNESGS